MGKEERALEEGTGEVAAWKGCHTLEDGGKEAVAKDWGLQEARRTQNRFSPAVSGRNAALLLTPSQLSENHAVIPNYTTER